MILNLYKKEGETPLQRMERFKAEHPDSALSKMTYAGRLDPMAEGVLVVLEGVDVHRKAEFLLLEKTYEFEILWGLSTDSHDILGLPEEKIADTSGVDVREKSKIIAGNHHLPYPNFSSRKLGGKPLFHWFRSGIKFEAPIRNMEVLAHEFLDSREVNSEELLRQITGRIAKVNGDFRQDKILTRWQNLLSSSPKNFQISRHRARVKSGTYIRSLAEMVGKESGLGALALRIKRTKVGEYDIKDAT